jgi:osmoprotectant transport system permease protein
VYPEYTGTLTAEILQGERIRSAEDLRAALAREKLKISSSLGFNNPYVIGLKEDLAGRLNLQKISDLAKPEHAKLRFGFSDEFMNRGDGWPGLRMTYDLPHQPQTLDHNLAYTGIHSGVLDVTDLYATDAEIKAFQLRLLEDDRGYFPAYHCVLLYREDLETRAPEVLASLLQLQGAIGNEEMIEMNARCKIDHVRDRQVAADFLNEKLGMRIQLPREPSLMVRTTTRHLLLVSISLAAAVSSPCRWESGRISGQSWGMRSWGSWESFKRCLRWRCWCSCCRSSGLVGSRRLWRCFFTACCRLCEGR